MLTVRVEEWHGRTGGWPVIEFSGTHVEIAALITTYACDQEDEEYYAGQTAWLQDGTAEVLLDVAWGDEFDDETIFDALRSICVAVDEAVPS